MPLPSPFRRKDKTEPALGDSEQPQVEALRTRARRRLIGAVVLLGVGIVAFPLLFETAPRPIPVDLPIEVPRKDGMPALPMPSSSPIAKGQVREAASVAPRDEGVASAAAPAPKAEPAVAVFEAPAAKAVETPAEPKPKPEAEPVKPTSKADDDGRRAKALLDGKAPIKASSPANAPSGADRWVVQIGAFAEDRTVRDVRAKASKLGMSTFTQVVVVQAGERTRVRVGPFSGRDDADDAAEKLKKAGLPATVLKL